MLSVILRPATEVSEPTVLAESSSPNISFRIVSGMSSATMLMLPPVIFLLYLSRASAAYRRPSAAFSSMLQSMGLPMEAQPV